MGVKGFSYERPVSLFLAAFLLDPRLTKRLNTTGNSKIETYLSYSINCETLNQRLLGCSSFVYYCFSCMKEVQYVWCRVPEGYNNKGIC